MIPYISLNYNLWCRKISISALPYTCSVLSSFPVFAQPFLLKMSHHYLIYIPPILQKKSPQSKVFQEIFLCFPSGYEVIFFLLTPTTLATSHIWLVALSCITVICLYLTYQTKGFLRQKLLTPLPHSSSCLAHCLAHSRCTEPMFLVEENWTYQ